MVTTTRQYDDAFILTTCRAREARPGLWIVTMPGEFMPHGNDYEVQVTGEVNNETKMQFCNAVRSEYERQKLNPAPKASRVGRSEGDNVRADPAPAVRNPRARPDPADQETAEGSLESYLESQVDEWIRRTDKAGDQLAHAREYYARAKRELAKAKRALRAARGGK